jgi:hypothetical protein
MLSCAPREFSSWQRVECELRGAVRRGIKVDRVITAVLQELDIERVWEVAEDGDRRVLIEELLEWVTIYPDHMEVTVAGAPPLNVLYSEVGLKQSQIGGVGEPIRSIPYWRPLAA